MYDNLKDNKAWQGLSRAKERGIFVPKNGYNKHYQSRYATAPDVCLTLTACLRAQGVEISQPTETVGGMVILHTLFIHTESGHIYRSSHPLSTPEDPQKYSIYLTYMRKLQMLSLAGVVPDDCNDGDLDRPIQSPLPIPVAKPPVNRKGGISREEFQRIKAAKQAASRNNYSDQRIPLPPNQ